jgi:class 3 adenylate cyclase
VAAERRLAAIVFTDIVGYTALSQQDEPAALRLLQEQERLIQGLLQIHRGRKVKSMGDGLLLEFPDALDAVECAVDFQRHLHDRNTRAMAAPLQVRVGIHVGDVEGFGADILGDAVNIASRIEPLADPGGVCLSEQVFAQVGNKVPYKIEGLGPKALKGIGGPVEIYRVIVVTPRPPEPAPASAAPRPAPVGASNPRGMPAPPVAPRANPARAARPLAPSSVGKPAPATLSAVSEADSLSPIREVILEAVHGARETVPGRAVATSTGLPLEVVQQELRGMVTSGLLATGRSPGSKEDLYWPVEEEFRPSIGLTQEVLGITMRVTQVDAVKRASSLMTRTEEVAIAELDQVPVWKISCRWTSKSLLSSAKDHVDDYYVSARSGAFMTIEGKQMRFEKIARKSAGRIEDLADQADVSFKSALPSEIGRMPPIEVSLPRATEILRTTFGVKPVDGRLALLPIWHLGLRRRDGRGAIRTVTMDAVSGKVVFGEY